MQIAIGTQIGYQAGAGGEAGVFDYLINDAFTTDRAAGSIEGTDAEPGPGGRTVNDPNNKLSIATDKLTIAAGSSSSWIQPAFYATPLVTPAVGRIVYFKWTATSNRIRLCLVVDKETQPFWSVYGAFGQLAWRSGTPVQVQSFSLSTQYETVMLIGQEGAYVLHKISSNWQLLWVFNAVIDINAVSPFYPMISTFDSTATADDLIVPAVRWLPSPLISDGFSSWGESDGLGHAEGVAGSAEGQGGDSVSWTDNDDSWGASGGLAGTTPTVGSDLVTDGGLETWNTATDLTSWTEQLGGSSTVDQETSVVHAGSNAARFTIDGSNSLAKISQSITNSNGDWLLVTLWAKTDVSGRSIAVDENNGSNVGQTLKLSTTYEPYASLIRATKDNTDIGVKRFTGTSANLYIDDISAQVIDLDTMIAGADLSEDDVLASVNITADAGTLAGLLICADSIASLANGILVLLDPSGLVHVCKLVAGALSLVTSETVTYSAGATLRAIKSGSAVRVFYNDAAAGSELTISDAGIVSNTIHGLIASDAGSTFDDFVVYARGTDGEYNSVLDAI